MKDDLNDINLNSEKAWVLQAKEDIVAFEPLYNKYSDEIYRYIFRRIGRENLSEELCSETFYKALKGINKYNWINIPFGNWLYTIATNEIRRHYRKRDNLFIVEIDKIQEQLPVEEIVERVSTDELVWVMQQLTEKEIRIIELKYFENKTFQEVGLLLGMKESAIKMRTYRLLLTMRKLITNNHDKI